MTRPELHRPVPVERVTPTHPLDVMVEATPAERAAVAARLAIPAVDRLRCGFALRRESDRIVADGRLSATVVQECVVSLEPFEAAVDEAFVVHFVREGEAAGDDADPLAPDEVVYAGAAIDLGEAAVEQLALSLDPYPRRPDAVLPDTAPETASVHPFAALTKLRRS